MQLINFLKTSLKNLKRKMSKKTISIFIIFILIISGCSFIPFIHKTNHQLKIVDISHYNKTFNIITIGLENVNEYFQDSNILTNEEKRILERSFIKWKMCMKYLSRHKKISISSLNVLCKIIKSGYVEALPILNEHFTDVNDNIRMLLISLDCQLHKLKICLEDLNYDPTEKNLKMTMTALQAVGTILSKLAPLLIF